MAEIKIRVTAPGAEQTRQAVQQITQEAVRGNQQVATSLQAVSQVANRSRAAVGGLTQTLSVGTSAASRLGLISEDTAGQIFNLTATMQGAAAAAGLLRAAMLALTGPVGIALAVSAALGVAVFKLVQHFRDKAKAANETADALVRYEAQVSRTTAQLSRMAHVQREGQLTALDFAKGQDLAARAIAEMDAKARESAKRTTTEAIKRQQAEVAALTDLFNRQAIEGIEAEERAAIEAGQRILEAERQQQAEVASLIQLGNIQAIAAIEQREQAAIEAGQRMLDAERQLANETASLISLANQQTIQAIDEEERARIEAGRRMLDAEKQRQESLVSGMQSALSGIVKITVQQGDVLGQIWKSIVDRIVAELARIAVVKLFGGLLGGPLGFLGGLFGFQRGGEMIVNRPTLFAAGEAGPERVSVSPMGGMQAAGAGGPTININAGTLIADELTWFRFIRQIERELGSSFVRRRGGMG